jgi:predicted RNA-binding Zn-ribbon protein involved in translation (DUF1610 family)
MKEYNIRGLCVECGAVYNETPYSFLCPKCRKKKQSESAKRRNLSKIGNEARWKKNE